MIADRRLYLDRTHTRLVEEGDPDSAMLLVPKGDEVPESEVKRLRLVERDGRVLQQPEVVGWVVVKPIAESPAVTPEPAVETTPESPAAPASVEKPVAPENIEIVPPPIMPSESRRGRGGRSRNR